MNISIDNLWYVYPGEIEALRGIDLTIRSQSSVLVLGHNGAGKSTLLKHLNGTLRPTKGNVFIGAFNAKDFESYELAQRVAVSFQNPDDQIFSSTVLKEVEFGPKNLGKFNAQALSLEILELVGLSKFIQHHPYDLHPTKRKFLAIASILAMDTPVIALDEPTAGMSFEDKQRFRKVFKWIQKRQKTVVVISHDIDFFIELCDQLLILKQGKVAFYGGKKELFSRADAKTILKESGLSLPLLPRIAQTIGLRQTITSVQEFIEEYSKAAS